MADYIQEWEEKNIPNQHSFKKAIKNFSDKILLDNNMTCLLKNKIQKMFLVEREQLLCDLKFLIFGLPVFLLI